MHLNQKINTLLSLVPTIPEFLKYQYLLLNLAFQETTP